MLSTTATTGTGSCRPQYSPACKNTSPKRNMRVVDKNTLCRREVFALLREGCTMMMILILILILIPKERKNKNNNNTNRSNSLSELYLMCIMSLK